MKTTMLCTVGISMKYEKFGHSIDEIVTNMLKYDPTNTRDLGAEINSIASILEREALDARKRLIFLVSDTDTARIIGEILEKYFKRHPELSFSNVQKDVIESLNDENPNEFKQRGLRNLVREIGKYIKEYQHELIINATGGYKAQIAFALALGQAVGVPVYYRFERFEHVIELPPLPLSLDVSFWLEYNNAFEELKINPIIEEKEFEKLVGVPYAQLDQKLKMLIDREKINGKNYISLNPMGMVFVQAVDIKAYTYELPQSDVPPEKRLQYSAKESNSIKFLEKHKANIMKIITADFVTRVIISGYSSKYDKPGVRVKQAGDIIKVDYSAKGGTLHMKVQTTARNNDELGIAVKKLQDLMFQ